MIDLSIDWVILLGVVAYLAIAVKEFEDALTLKVPIWRAFLIAPFWPIHYLWVLFAAILKR